MVDKLKGSLPLALVIGVLAFLWCEFALNFTFHWVTNGDLGNGLALPASFHLVVPAAFIAWGFFFAVVLVLMSALGDWHYVAATFGAFASVFFGWTATGLDYWAKGGGGTNTVAALKDLATAGTGAFGGVLSTPYVWVWLSVSASLLCGCGLGLASVKLTALVTPRVPVEVEEDLVAPRSRSPRTA